MIIGSVLVNDMSLANEHVGSQSDPPLFLSDWVQNTKVATTKTLNWILPNVTGGMSMFSAVYG